jgi:Sulfatase
MIQEIDTWVGKLLDRLDAAGATNSTLIVVTSDHGEMLGAHSMLNKGILLEEAARVPLVLSYPGVIPSGKVIPASTPVSHIDLFATLLDYTYASKHDSSDGSSLRRFIEDQSFNERYDERTVMVEIDMRFPKNKNKLNEGLGERPNFMIRKGNCKLLLPKNRNSDVIDMMYDLSSDPAEMTNLLSAMNYDSANDVPDAVVGKAEHLKVMLVENLWRYDGDRQFYSSNRWNVGEGDGDIAEIEKRRTWRMAEYWQSDVALSFGPPVLVDGSYVRNEYVYVGRTAEGTMDVYDMYVSGPDAAFFSLNVTAASEKSNGGGLGGLPLGKVSRGQYVRARVRFSSTEPVSIAGLSATIVIRNSVHGYSEIVIAGEE